MTLKKKNFPNIIKIIPIIYIFYYYYYYLVGIWNRWFNKYEIKAESNSPFYQKTILSIIPYHFTIHPISQFLFYNITH